MLALLIFFRLLLASVFALAGFTKLGDLARTRADFESLGLPAQYVPALSLCLPLIELGIGALLLLGPLSNLGAAGALGLLTIFTTVIGVNLWRGRQATCACFGSLSRVKIGPAMLARNGGLMAVAGVLLLPSPKTALDFVVLSPAVLLIGAFAIFGCSVLFGTWLFFQLWRQQGRLLLRIEQMEQRTGTRMATTETPESVTLPRPAELVNKPVPVFTLHDMTGKRVDLHMLRGRPTVVFFLDSNCKHCRSLLLRLRTWSPAAHVIIILAGQDHPPIEFAPDSVVVNSDALIAMQAFGVLSTPTAIAIAADGIVAEPAARGNPAVTQLMDRFSEQPQEAQHEFATV